MPLEQITTEMDVQEPQKGKKLQVMKKKVVQKETPEERAETIRQGRELDRTVASPYQMAMAEKAKAAEIEKKKGKLLTPKRTLEVADSLEKNAYSTMGAASKLKNKAKTEIEKRGSDYLQSSGMNDLRNSEKYRSLALKAMNKKK